MTQINKWLQGLYNQELDFTQPYSPSEINENDITYWHAQQCIGYQTSGEQLISVFKAQVEMNDGSIKDVWYLQEGMSVSKTIVLSQPRIDIQQFDDATKPDTH